MRTICTEWSFSHKSSRGSAESTYPPAKSAVHPRLRPISDARFQSRFVSCWAVRPTSWTERQQRHSSKSITIADLSSRVQNPIYCKKLNFTFHTSRLTHPVDHVIYSRHQVTCESPAKDRQDAFSLRYEYASSMVHLTKL